MLLTTEELNSLANLKHRSPHQLLGMHPLGDGTGIVARALIPDAQKIELSPTHEKTKPTFELARIAGTDLFEGVSHKAKAVYAYDLTITAKDGKKRRTRDAYSFLPTLGETDLFLFGQGNELRIYDKLGSHLRIIDGVPGTSFAVWAPNAQSVSIVANFNDWDGRANPMRLLGASGVWELFIPGVSEGALYKYEIRDIHGNLVLKTDPFATFSERPPKQASIVWNVEKFQWSDNAWLEARGKADWLRKPT